MLASRRGSVPSVCFLRSYFAVAFALVSFAAAFAQAPAAKPSTPAAYPGTHPASRPPVDAASTDGLPLKPPRAVLGHVAVVHFTDLRPGSGAPAPVSLPATNKFYLWTVHYNLWKAADGSRIDSTIDRNLPISFLAGTGDIMPAWEKGLKGMRLGGRRRIFIPLAQAQGKPLSVPATGDLIFDVQLVAVNEEDRSGRHPRPADLSALAPEALRKQAAACDPAAEYELAQRFAQGVRGFQPDPAQSLFWFNRAAGQGVADARFQAGLRYLSGNGVAADPPAAFQLIQSAARQSDPAAQELLAALYWNGQGVVADRAQALQWYRKAADAGLPASQSFLADLYLRGDGIPSDPAQAVALLRKAADQHYAPAESSLAARYLDGQGIARDPAQAIAWYGKAAAAGFAPAANALGDLYFRGDGVPQDNAQALGWYNKAAGLGSAPAEITLGNIYRDGKGVSQSYETARSWYAKADALREPTAAALIADLDLRSAAAAQPLGSGPPPTFQLTKEQLNSIDKNARNLFKRCMNSPKLKPQDQAQACWNFGGELSRAGRDPSIVRSAFDRGCMLGSAGSCASAGDVRAQAGEIPAARTLWTTGLCANSDPCLHKAFDSYAGDKPPDVAMALRFGLPLCDKGRDDKVCEKLRGIGAQADWAGIAKHHKDARIEEIDAQIKKNNNDIAVSTGLLAMAQAGSNSATGFLQKLTAEGEVKLYQSSINQAQKENATLTAELQTLGASASAPSGPGLGAALGGLAFSGIANAANIQNSGGTLNAASFVPDNTSQILGQSASPTQPDSVSAAATAGGASGTPGRILYNDQNADWVRRMLGFSGSYSCAPKRPPAIPTAAQMPCAAEDGYFYQAEQLAWAVECEEELGHHDDAVKLSGNLVETLKNSADGCGGFKFNGASGCTTERLFACNQRPHH